MSLGRRPPAAGLKTSLWTFREDLEVGQSSPSAHAAHRDLRVGRASVNATICMAPKQIDRAATATLADGRRLELVFTSKQLFLEVKDAIGRRAWKKRVPVDQSSRAAWAEQQLQLSPAQWTRLHDFKTTLVNHTGRPQLSVYSPTRARTPILTPFLFAVAAVVSADGCDASSSATHTHDEEECPGELCSPITTEMPSWPRRMPWGGRRSAVLTRVLRLFSDAGFQPGNDPRADRPRTSPSPFEGMTPAPTHAPAPARAHTSKNHADPTTYARTPTKMRSMSWQEDQMSGMILRARIDRAPPLNRLKARLLHPRTRPCVNAATRPRIMPIRPRTHTQ